METTENRKPYAGVYYGGLALVLLSFCVYVLGRRSQTMNGIFSDTFFLNYGAALIYLVALLVSKLSQPRPRPDIYPGCWINMVMLWSISAFSLNVEMQVFSEFPGWLNIYTLLSLPLLMIYPYYEKLPGLFRTMVLLLTGAGLVLSFYMFVYLLPLYGYAVLGLLFIGVGVHAFVPLLWLWIFISFITRLGKGRGLVIAGASLPILFLTIYLVKWNRLQSEIREIVARQNIRFSNTLPEDIYLAQQLPEDPMTEEILIASHKAQRFWGDDSFLWGGNTEKKYHSPLAVLGVAFFDEISLPEHTVESLLNIRKDYRHTNTRKFWTGSNLTTNAVSTNIRLFPEYRMAYHEKIILIHNDPYKNTERSWFNTETQEALYTFHLPEGSIVTSLSLWMNGREEKSRLSTRRKADSAYAQIVGVQRRDPALVHWQEGNRITVNVFPCTEKEDRKFKIGFTTPLRLEKEELVLENIWFEGPDMREASEVTQILVNEHTRLKVTDRQWEKQANGNLYYEGKLRTAWQLKMPSPKLSGASFRFAGFSYSLHQAVPVKENVKLNDIYLELNKEWTRQEYEELIAKTQGKKLYAWLPEKTRITAENKTQVWETGSANKFSIPFLYDIVTPENSVLVTKGSHRSPLLADLKNSELADRFTGYLAGRPPIRVLNIGDEDSPFWRSLNELRVASTVRTDLGSALALIHEGTFSQFPESDSQTVFAGSGFCIRKEPANDSTPSKAPDHLLRLFAYNDLMRKVGGHYFEKENYEEELFRQAEEAYVLCPLTSLVVLETENDYQRFGIEKNNNTVGNASVLGGGAVPEPHEWALLCLFVAFLLLQAYRKKYAAVRS